MRQLKLEDMVPGMKLGSNESLATLIEDLTRPPGVGNDFEIRRSRAKAVFEYMHSLQVAKNSEQVRYATLVIAGATVFNAIVLTITLFFL